MDEVRPVGRRIGTFASPVVFRVQSKETRCARSLAIAEARKAIDEDFERRSTSRSAGHLTQDNGSQQSGETSDDGVF